MNMLISPLSHARSRAAKFPKTGTLALAAAALLAAYGPAAPAATITTFAQLDALTPTASYSAGTFSTPGGGVDKQDFTFQFDFTTPSTLSGNSVLLDIGGSTGTSLRLEGDRLVFRSGVNNGALMYVTSNELSTGTQYNVVGSLFNSPDDSGDFMRLYLDEADGVDATQANHDPDDTVNDFWGGNQSGYGEIGGGDHQIGTTVGDGIGTGTAFTSTDGTLDTDVDFFHGTYLNIPEPASLALMGLGGLLMLGRGRRQA